MLSFNPASPHFVVLRHFFLDAGARAYPPPLLLVFDPRTRRRRAGAEVLTLNLVSPSKSGSLLGKPDNGRRKRRPVRGGSGFARRCKRNGEREGDWDLEAEIFEFMRDSGNPDLFPTKKQLIDAGRMDLVEAILRQGGWLSLGWDLDGEDESMVQDDCDFRDFGSAKSDDFDYGILQERINENQESLTLEGNGSPGVSPFSSNFSGSVSSSCGSTGSLSEDNSGIEGILSRLEIERDITFGVGLRGKGSDVRDDWLVRTQADETVARRESSSESTSLNSKDIINETGRNFSQHRTSLDINIARNSLQPGTWRTWSSQRVGCVNSDFEAAEIDVAAYRLDKDKEFKKSDILKLREINGDPLNRQKESNISAGEANHNFIKDRLQHLELELSSVLSSLRSKSTMDEQENLESISDDLQELSDAWEFQENEIMNSKDKMRSMRAKLAVLEGKMSLAIIDAHKIAEEKQRKIDDARRALQVLRTACIVWPNSATEVLLAGSFDGWATQRKMEKSSTMVFSVCLKLYPGRYEIKFIVDGVWRIDPLRPIVHNNGYENNLLIIT
ncbi:protein PTST homolog 2, chloroplastic isoform X2 [Syzygium oleosum]|uniref:protein PTST homolog 2, chloroplastic isoform X2 n=1 Tax=Syzygium oleosum TaxID=219896 RepID=UPI0011D1D37E|nr:protein PTST homolog 2, chloroplastic isoform X2 [Syzygium oleosum]